MKLEIRKVFRPWWDFHPWRVVDCRYFVNGLEVDVLGRPLQVKS